MGCKDLPVCILSSTLLMMSFFFFLLFIMENFKHTLKYKNMQNRIMSSDLPISQLQDYQLITNSASFILPLTFSIS